jgi:hypothetical protein
VGENKNKKQKQIEKVRKRRGGMGEERPAHHLRFKSLEEADVDDLTRSSTARKVIEQNTTPAIYVHWRRASDTSRECDSGK